MNKMYCNANEKLKILGFSDLSELCFVPSSADSLHLGDREILGSLCKKINFLIDAKTNGHKVNLTLKKHAKNDGDVPSLSLDYASNIFPCEEFSVISYLCKNLKKTFTPINPDIIVNGEIASNFLRIFGFRSKLKKTLCFFHTLGFRFTYLGQKIPSFLSNVNFHSFKTGIEVGEKMIVSKKYFAIITFDNFWMHFSLKHDLRTYAIQRRKLTFQNLTNHLIFLNNSCSKNKLKQIV